MEINPLTLDHQAMLQEKLRKLDLMLSEYSFANLYLFRQTHLYEVVTIEEEVFIKGITRDRLSFVMPTSPPEKISLLALRQAASLANVFFPIPEIWLDSFTKKLSINLTQDPFFKEEDSDYLYSSSKLSRFSGRQFNGKRNQMAQLHKKSQLKIENLEFQISDAQSILENWQKEKGSDLLSTDYLACCEALLNFQKLQLKGLIVYVNDRPAAFTIGEQISKDCFDLHFSKASHSIKGLYPLLFRETSRLQQSLCRWINLEQDLGIPELRYSKTSYRPDFLLKKWRIPTA